MAPKAKNSKEKGGKEATVTNDSLDEHLDMESSEVRTQRIKDRFFRALGVGFVLDIIEERNAAAAKEATGKPAKEAKKPKKNGNGLEDDRGFMKKAEGMAGPLMMLALIVVIIAMKAGEDGWTPAHEPGEDYYAIMGVPRDANLMDIKRAYKKLALSWHPDKHPDCETCKDKFAKISEASEVLSDPERKQAYDSKSKAKNKLQTANSVDLTADDFQTKVLRSNEVWIVQIYDPSQESCAHFHPTWEDVSTKEAKVARFGRVNILMHKEVMKMLPQRVMYTPAIFKFGRGMAPELFEFDRSDEGTGTSALVQFAHQAIPELPLISSAKEVTSWQNEERPRVLLAGPSVKQMRNKRRGQFLSAAHVAFQWAEFFDFKVVEAKIGQEALGTELVAYEHRSDETWSVLVAGSKGEALKSYQAKDTEELAEVLSANLEIAVTARAPFLTIRNYRQLCGARNDELRNYCLFLVDVKDNDVAKLTQELAKSKVTYQQELQDLRDSGDENAGATEDNFRIQPVRIRTSSSHFPWVPDCPNYRAFYGALWSHAARSPMFLLEWETRRFAAIKGKGLEDVFQNIAYEDVRFKELPEEGDHLVTILPDPESSLRAELRRVLTSVLGAMAAVLLLAGAAAVLPELSIPVAGVSIGSFLMFVLLCWPALCRRILGKLLFMY